MLRQDRVLKKMTSCSAELMFWRTPDLVEKLLPFLDAKATLYLAESRISCTLHILQNQSAAWKKLVKRSLPGSHQIELARLNHEEYLDAVRATFEERRTEVNLLVAILKMVDEKTQTPTCWIFLRSSVRSLLQMRVQRGVRVL